VALRHTPRATYEPDLSNLPKEAPSERQETWRKKEKKNTP
jgi:hypothetical protein